LSFLLNWDYLYKNKVTVTFPLYFPLDICDLERKEKVLNTIKDRKNIKKIN